MTLGEKLAELRQKSGLSQDRVAELLGVSRQAVSKWERDEAKPDLDNIVNLSNIYNVTTDYLLKEKQEKIQEEKKENTYNYKSSSVFEDILRFVKEKWYWLGYGVLIWGVVDIAQAIIVNIMWKSFAGNIMGYDQFGISTDVTTSVSANLDNVVESGQMMDPFLGTVMDASSYALWLPILTGLLKVAVGIAVVIYGRRYVRRMKARSY
ncbi:MAG: helix-turn-helix domain-containing protein [Clostridiaceae bacterium]